MLVTRPLNDGEPDLLFGKECCDLCFYGGDGKRKIAVYKPPLGGWTHNALEAVSHPEQMPWDAFLGTQWIGSSEI